MSVIRQLIKYRFLVLIIGLLLSSGTFYSNVLAQDQIITDDEVNTVAKELYCPVCESTPLDVCPTQACADWREVIRDKLSQGQSAEEIEAYFALQYGPRALAEPPQDGFSFAIWILPIAAIIVGGFFFIRYVRGIRDDQALATANGLAEPGPGMSEGDGDADDYESRIEQEIREKYS